ncbi:MAG TPA: response regulator [Actinomycetota bacterium]
MARVLVLEDEASARELVSTALRLQGHEPIEATRGRDAISLLEHDHFDGAVIDLRMSDVDGYQVLRVIRSGSETKRLPVVVVTGDEEAAERCRRLDLRPTSVVSKPFDYETLSSAINAITIPRVSPLRADHAPHVRIDGRELHRSLVELQIEVDHELEAGES